MVVIFRSSWKELTVLLNIDFSTNVWLWMGSGDWDHSQEKSLFLTSKNLQMCSTSSLELNFVGSLSFREKWTSFFFFQNSRVQISNWSVFHLVGIKGNSNSLRDKCPKYWNSILVKGSCYWWHPLCWLTYRGTCYQPNNAITIVKSMTWPINAW
jgi:hypothetical protein